MSSSIIIPTYNECLALPGLIQDLERVYSCVNFPPRIIIVDDGSTDGTAEWVRGYRSICFDIQVIERTDKGLSSAILLGITESQTDAVLIMDADQSHPVEKVPIMFAGLKEAELVIGTRRLPGGGVEEWPWYRKIMSRMGEYGSRLLRITVSDPMSGFFALRTELLEDVIIKPRGYKILLDILVKAQPEKVEEIPYLFRNRDVGESKLSTRVVLAYVRQIVSLKTWQVRRKGGL